MLAVIQKVSSASVEVGSKISGKIDAGYCILLGIKDTDTNADVDYLVEKILKIRIFEEGDKRFKKNIVEAGGSILVIPQYTLYGDIKSKNSPSFTHAMAPDQAYVLFNEFCIRMEGKGITLKKGMFREYMKMNIVNEGPVTFLLNSDHLHAKDK